MRPIVIPTRCRGNGVCEQFVPEVFQVDDNKMAGVVDEDPNESLHIRVRNAVIDMTTNIISKPARTTATGCAEP